MNAAKPLRREVNRVRRIVFVTEQDGEPQRRLKARLVERFHSSAGLLEAFLVWARYDDASDLNMAPCLKIDKGIPDFELIKADGAEFANIFNSREHIDTLFLTPAQYQQIVTVARPFYRRSSPGGE